MTKLREKAQARTMQMVGEMIGDDQLVREGKILYVGTSNFAGGATGWLTTSGNVVPGETITLRFVVWDTSDHIYDSLVLLDNFQWSVDASDPGTKNGG